MIGARQYPGMVLSVSYRPLMMGMSLPLSTSRRILAVGFTYNFSSSNNIAVVFIVFSPKKAITMPFLEKIRYHGDRGPGVARRVAPRTVIAEKGPGVARRVAPRAAIAEKGPGGRTKGGPACGNCRKRSWGHFCQMA